MIRYTLEPSFRFAKMVFEVTFKVLGGTVGEGVGEGVGFEVGCGLFVGEGVEAGEVVEEGAVKVAVIAPAPFIVTDVEAELEFSKLIESEGLALQDEKV
jgi:hypothetical protein